MESLVKVFKALSDETRIRILNVLQERECCVCEVMQALDISQPRASRHLAILKNAGLVKSVKEGLWKVYSIDEKEMDSCPARLIEAIRSALASDVIALEDKERLNRASRVGTRAMLKADFLK